MKNVMIFESRKPRRGTPLLEVESNISEHTHHNAPLIALSQAILVWQEETSNDTYNIVTKINPRAMNLPASLIAMVSFAFLAALPMLFSSSSGKAPARQPLPPTQPAPQPPAVAPATNPPIKPLINHKLLRLSRENASRVQETVCFPLERLHRTYLRKILWKYYCWNRRSSILLWSMRRSGDWHSRHSCVEHLCLGSLVPRLSRFRFRSHLSERMLQLD